LTRFHFIAGLPRSGSTLLSAILRQNPDIHASISSPVNQLFNVKLQAMSGANEAAIMLTPAQRERSLKAEFEAIYADAPDIVFDTNRLWPSKLPALARMFPDCKVICCVRRIGMIVDSIENLVADNPFELSGMFGFDPSSSALTRVQHLMSNTGLVGRSLAAFRDGFYSPLGLTRMRVIEYEALVRNPAAAIAAVYDWTGIQPYPHHDFEHVDQIPGAAEFDRQLKTPGLHRVKPKVEFRERKNRLPAEILRSLPGPFWRTHNPGVPVMQVDDDAGADAPAASARETSPPTQDEIDTMVKNAQTLLADAVGEKALA
jgi:sulfotransferase